MGYTIHHSIVVASWDLPLLTEARAFAQSVGANVSEFVPWIVNGGAAFLVAPDGSKEGWSESDQGDERRDAIKNFLKSKAYEDGSNCLRWFEVSHPEDESPEISDCQKPTEEEEPDG